MGRTTGFQSGRHSFDSKHLAIFFFTLFLIFVNFGDCSSFYSYENYCSPPLILSRCFTIKNDSCRYSFFSIIMFFQNLVVFSTSFSHCFPRHNFLNLTKAGYAKPRQELETSKSPSSENFRYFETKRTDKKL